MLKIVKQSSFLIVVGILLVVFFPGYAKIQELRQKNKDLEENAKRLQAENIKLSEEKERLEKDPEYLERVARQKLGIIKKGEVVYKVVSPEKKNNP